MAKAKLMNELIKQHDHYCRNKLDYEIRSYYFGFLDACKLVLTEKQMLSCMSETKKNIKNKIGG